MWGHDSHEASTDGVRGAPLRPAYCAYSATDCLGGARVTRLFMMHESAMVRGKL